MLVTQTTPRVIATIAGYSALLMWSCAGFFSAILCGLPVFEVLSIAFAVSFIFTSSLITVRKEWHCIKQPKRLWLIGMIAVFGNDVLFLTAFHLAPAAQVDLISYLWPLIVILFLGLLPHERFSPRHLLAVLCGLSGLYFLLQPLQYNDELQSRYLLGYFCAATDAIIWGGYVLVSRYHKKTNPLVSGLYAGLLTPLALVLHLNFESFMMPNPKQWCWLILMGLTTQSSTYILWDYGIKEGHFKLLTILTYTTPFISILLLAINEFAHLNQSLGYACLLITFAGVIAGVERRRI